MGTRSEIYVRRKDWGAGAAIELWKHWDGDENSMIPLFQDFAKWAKDLWRQQPHWLSYPSDVAALLIAYDFKDAEKRAKAYREEGMGYNYPLRPDIRPRGNTNDLEYVWILDIVTESSDEGLTNLRWKVTGYKINGFDMADTTRNAIKEGDDRLIGVQVVDETVLKLGKVFL